MNNEQVCNKQTLFLAHLNINNMLDKNSSLNIKHYY